MKPLIFAPQHPELRQNVIHRYEFYDFDATTPLDGEFLVLPGFDTGFLFSFYRSQPILVKNKGLNYEALPPDNLIAPVGLPTYNANIKDLRIIRVIFYPGAFTDLYGVSLELFRNEVIELGYSIDKELSFLQSRLASPTLPNIQVSIIEEYLLDKIKLKSAKKQNKGVELFRHLDKLMSNELRNSYISSANELAKKLGLSESTFKRHLKHKVGFTPYEFINVYRINEVIKCLHNITKNTSLTDLAYDFGYADQSHFIKNFKKMTNQTPGQYLRSIGKANIVLSTSGKELEENGLFLSS